MTEPTTDAPSSPDPQPITRDQATSMVARHMLVVLEDVIAAHQAVLGDEKKTEVQKGNARLFIAAAQAFGRPLFVVAKAAERPRILRPERSIHIVR